MSILRFTLRCTGVASLALLVSLNFGCAAASQRVPSNPGNHISKVAESLRRQAPIPQALPTELEKQFPAEYIVMPGDVLRAEMVDLDSPIRLPADQPVQLDGKIDLGAYGRLLVAGMPLEAAEKQVQSTIKAKSKDAGEVRLRLLTAESKTYFVLGEVNAPGEFTLQGRESVLNGIVRAGGLTSNADVTKILVARPTKPCDCRKVMPVCYRNIVQIGDTSTNYQLQPGDRIFIPKRNLWEEFWKTFHRKKDCDPCNLPQSGCPAPALVCPGGDCCRPIAPATTTPVEAPMPTKVSSVSKKPTLGSSLEDPATAASASVTLRPAGTPTLR